MAAGWSPHPMTYSTCGSAMWARASPLCRSDPPPAGLGALTLAGSEKLSKCQHKIGLLKIITWHGVMMRASQQHKSALFGLQGWVQPQCADNLASLCS